MKKENISNNVSIVSPIKKGKKATFLALLKHKRNQLFLLTYSMFMMVYSPLLTASAATAQGDNGTWTNGLNFLSGWVQKLGGGIFLAGLIELAMGIHGDDASSKTKGIRFMASGAILIAVGSVGVSLIK